MAFANNANGLYSVTAVGVKVQVTLGGTVKRGNLLGYNSGWVVADDSSGYAAVLIALNDGVSGDVIEVCRAAVISGVTGATAGAKVYLGESGEFDVSTGTLTNAQVVGTFISATEMLIDLTGFLPWASMPAVTQHKMIAGVGASGVPTVCAVAGDLTMTAAGTDATFAIASGAIVNADVSGTAGIALSKLEAGTTTYVPISNGTNFVEHPLSGDVTMTNAGAVSVSAAKLDAKHVTTIADANVVGGIPFLYRINVADGTGNTDVTVTYKSRVVDFWFVNTGIAAHAANDTIQLKNGASAISAALAKTATVNATVRATTMDPSQVEIAAGGTLRIAAVKDTNSAVTAYVLCVKVA